MSGTRPTVERPDVETQWTTDRGSSGLVPDGQTTRRAVCPLCDRRPVHGSGGWGDTTIVAQGEHILFAFNLLAVTASAIYGNGRAAVLAIRTLGCKHQLFLSRTVLRVCPKPCSLSLAAP